MHSGNVSSLSPVKSGGTVTWEMFDSPRNRSGTAGGNFPSTAPNINRAASTYQEKGDYLFQQEKYLAEFSKLRVEREKLKVEQMKEQMEVEREKHAMDEEERRLKKLKLESDVKAASERMEAAKEERVFQKKRRESIEDKVTTPILVSHKMLPLMKDISENSSVRSRTSIGSANNALNISTLNMYKKKGKKKKHRFSRSKVHALVSGFEEIETKEEVFEDDEIDDATMMLRMLDTGNNETDPRKWGMEDVVQWLKSINLTMYENLFRQQNIDGSMLYNDITQVHHLKDLGVSGFHAKKMLREIEFLRHEQQKEDTEIVDARNFTHNDVQHKNIILEDEELEDDITVHTELEEINMNPFTLTRELFIEMDVNRMGYLDMPAFRSAMFILGLSLDEQQTESVYNQWHFSAEKGITEEEFLFAMISYFVQNHCTDAHQAFRLSVLECLQKTGLVTGYDNHMEDLFENVGEVEKNMLEWSMDDENGIRVKPFMEEKLLKLMKRAGNLVTMLNGKRVTTSEEFDDMQCARIAGNGVHLSVLKIWWEFSIVHGIQSTYTSIDGKHFTSIKHASAMVFDAVQDINETIIPLKHELSICM